MTPPLNPQTTMTTTPNVYRRCFTTLVMFASLALLPGSSAFAQLATSDAVVEPLVAAAALPGSIAGIVAFTPLDLRSVPPGNHLSSSLSADTNLPEAPSEVLVEPIYTKYIPADTAAQPITARDKVIIGLRDLYNPLSFTGFVLGGAYAQVLNIEPNYGTDRGALGERMGAAAIRGTSQGIFTDTVFAPLLHEDPRYYIEGPQYGFIRRAAYAATRPLITRTDSGHSTVNGAMLLGYAAAAALSYTYYPKSNQNVHDTISTYGGSIGGEALAFLVFEFSSDVMRTLHLARPE